MVKRLMMKLIAKVLRSLTPKFDHMVTVIEEFKDLFVFSFDELMGSLQAHEVRINRSIEKNEEKVFQAKGESSNQNEKLSEQGRGRGGFRGRGHRRGRDRGQSNWSNNRRDEVECYHCNKFGHIEAECWYKNDQASYAEEKREESMLFMAHSDFVNCDNNVWYVNSDCSNHMSSVRVIFKEHDESERKQIRLGDNKQIQVEGKGIFTVMTSNGKVKDIQNVLFAPSLAHNLLSVGQLLDNDFSIMFDDRKCVIKKNKKF
ncbi:Retrovirus-related Pol polyprotein from transposon TNT 1-94 [Quillaja saponaria]|uniref:Retrovirus-related Pol polyprotein from transposon TNT 1-94 n=1 Tax=Quillaja saponaria TaxID=32244 RepID=A0AAD7LPZ9_QUISA|nr:Retrovirus-related Pol polyprotein from transposon TNT 1-94 [Quillaja saponaria]